MKTIRQQLTVATCALLHPVTSQADYSDNAWRIDSSLMNYEEDNRVSVTKLVGEVNGNVSDRDNVSIKASIDTMTGATPTGAVEGNSTVTITSPSGGGGFDASGGSAALAPFDDTRASINLDWDHMLDRKYSVVYNGAVSIENDYRSFSGGATFNINNDTKSTTYNLGLAASYDTIFRVGGSQTPEPLGNVEDQNFFSEGKKTTIDWIAGVSHVINRRTVGQANFSQSYSKGYLTDPYKVVSATQYDPGSGANLELARYFENRPGDRTRNSITTSVAHQLYPSDDIIHVSYRYYFDSWNIKAHTLDFKYQWKLQGSSIEPHLRLYSQSEAEFFTRELDASASLPEYASADSRLDKFTGITIGAKYILPLEHGGKFWVRAEYIQQNFDQAFFEENTAIVLQVNYQKKF